MLILINLYHDKFEIWRYPQMMFEELKTSFPNVDFQYIKTKDEFDRLLPDADAIIGWRLDEKDLPKAKKLRWFHTMAAGIGSMFYPAFLESDIQLTNSSAVRAAPMADYIMGLIIIFAKRFPVLLNAQQKKYWARFDYWREINTTIDLDKSTLGIIGYGGIGRELAKRAKSCGMRILATKKHASPTPPEVDVLYTPDGVDEVLKASDFIALTLPSTPETDGIIGKRELELMKKTAFLINVGRGKLIDSNALIEALQKGDIAGAGLDVFDPEPPESSNPLWTMDNVIITPHISGIGPYFWERSQDLLIDNIRAFIENKPLRNLIDKKLQY